MLTYWRVRSALKTARALHKEKITNFESDSIIFVFLCLALVSFSNFSLADENNLQKFDKYTVHYSVFSSTAISAEMAQRYGLVRGKDRVYVNIAVVPNNKQFGGVKAEVSGVAANLMQQQKVLEFREIAETDAVYYLALLRHTDREVFHFTINVNPEGQDPEGRDGPYQLKFTKELFLGL